MLPLPLILSIIAITKAFRLAGELELLRKELRRLTQLLAAQSRPPKTLPPPPIPAPNALLYTLGLPAFFSATLALALSRHPHPAAKTFSSITTIAALALLFFLASFEIRHAFDGPVLALDHLDHLSARITERATYPLVWLLLAAALLFAGIRAKSKTLINASYVFSFLALLFLLLVQILFQNPLSIPDDVGHALILNRLLYAYALPALLTAAFAKFLYTRPPTLEDTMPLARLHLLLSILLFFTLITLEVRQAFQGPILNLPGRPAPAEMYAYSAAWALFGTILLLAGILTKGPVLRWASLAVMLLTILKVFLFDTAHLTDIYRVLSFAGLGLSLILLAFLYHYFVFRKPPADTTIPPTAPPNV